MLIYGNNTSIIRRLSGWRIAQWKSHRFYKHEATGSNPGWNQINFQFK
jgi:hypothetical protein